jgi:MinD-like ATPase involved in chromosome partitioning or flagellar assembly
MPITLHGHQDIPTDSRTYGGTGWCKDTQADSHASECVVIVLANHKGGVTKTTSTASLGATFAEARRRVVAVD